MSEKDVIIGNFSDFVNISSEVITEAVVEVGRIGLWLQTLGLLVVIWIAIQGITLYFNRERRMAIFEIKERMEKIEKKLNKIEKLLPSRKSRK